VLKCAIQSRNNFPSETVEVWMLLDKSSRSSLGAKTRKSMIRGGADFKTSIPPDIARLLFFSFVDIRSHDCAVLDGKAGW
jgi:hypothetical protein